MALQSQTGAPPETVTPSDMALLLGVTARVSLLPGMHVLSMRDAVFIVSPKTLNLGSLVPMRPVTTGPVWMPTRTRLGCPLCGIGTVLAQRRRAWW